MEATKGHNNWIIIAELLRLVREPLVPYVKKVIENFHKSLQRHSTPLGKCENPEACQNIKSTANLCLKCSNWLQELKAYHRSDDKSKIKWRTNCVTSKWPDDSWEVAKFFMSYLGDSKDRVKDAQSTDLSSLLNVLEWLMNKAFNGNGRVSVELVAKLRSDVRNAWAHAPKQEATLEQTNLAFEIVHEFLASLESVFTEGDVAAVRQKVQFLETNGLANVVEAELKALTIFRKEFSAEVVRIKDEINDLRNDQNSDRKTIRNYEEQLKALERSVEDCTKQMDLFRETFERRRTGLDNPYFHFQDFYTFRDETKNELREMRKSMKQLQQFVRNDTCFRNEFKLTSCFPEKLSTFVGRDNEVSDVVDCILQKTGIVSLVGGPGFGKSTVAVEVAHRLNSDHQFPVFFCSVRTTSDISQVIIRICHVIGIPPQENPEWSLTVWLRNLQKASVLVMDNVEQLLEDDTREKFCDLLRLMREQSGKNLHIVLTSRRRLDVSSLEVKNVDVRELDHESCIQLIRNRCPQIDLQDDLAHDLVELCGRVPLALCIAASRLHDVDDPELLLTWLREKPMKALQTPSEKVENSIKISFDMLQKKEQALLVRLSVFDGSFDRAAAESVTELEDDETQIHLSRLVNRSLVERREKRFSLHLLIRSFLRNREGFDLERKRTEKMMVQHFLKVCHALTEKYWSKDGFCQAKALFQTDARNVEKVIRMCEEAVAGSADGDQIVKILRQSELYKSSTRFFYHFIVHLVSQNVVRSFLNSCNEVARKNHDVVVEVVVKCLIAHVVCRISGWNSDEFMDHIKLIKDLFEKNDLEGAQDAESLLEIRYITAHSVCVCSNRLCPGQRQNRCLKRRTNICANI